MSFHFWSTEADEAFVPEADPVLFGKMTKTAGAAIMQDIGMNTYWANICGKSPLKYKGVSQMLQQELEQNLDKMMQTRMSYRELEEFMTTLGYEAGDIRRSFKKLTGLDPVKLDYMRAEDVKNTPSNIPWYNCGWGHAKKGDGSYFIMPSAGGIYMVFNQADDMTRKEVKSFLRHDEALEHLGGLVKITHRYDSSAAEQVGDALRAAIKEPQKKDYQVMASYISNLMERNMMDKNQATRLVRDAVYSGSLTQEEGSTMLRVYADVMDTADISTTPQHTAPTPDNSGQTEELSNAQKHRVLDEMDKKTPQDFFEAALPDRVEEVAANHVKGVLGYIANRESDMGDFEVKMYSMEYKRHDAPRSVVEIDPETGRRSGPPTATISVVLEIHDKTLPNEGSRKFALAVFFVSTDGEVTTSDSIKGEDDIIYGFTEDGMRQYFAKERMSGA